MSRLVLASVATALVVTVAGSVAVHVGAPAREPPAAARLSTSGAGGAEPAGPGGPRDAAPAGTGAAVSPVRPSGWGPVPAPGAGPARPAVGDEGRGDAGRWRWPLAPRPPVLRRFRAPPDPWAAGHRGLDLAASAGSVVLAVEAGLVTHAGMVAGRQTVTVTHADGLRSTYEPLQPSVRAGDVVPVGGRLGVLTPATAAAAGHCGARVCLHLGARRGDEYLDPWPLLVGARTVLLPLR